VGDCLNCQGFLNSWEIWPAGQLLLPADELLLTRDMSYSETFALAKEYEETQLLKAMQSDIVAQLMRRLSRVKNVAG